LAEQNVEDTSAPAENEWFEGTLLLACRDEKAVDTAVVKIEGTSTTSYLRSR